MEQSNKHTGTSFDSFLKEEKLEPLEKKCPRCGGKSATSSNPSGRCSSCLKKLASAKKKPGNYLHEHKVADDALRRQKGKNGTASKKTSGLGSRKAIIKKVKAGEKKAGTVLSPDRINNKKGYSSSNTRMVPKELNRGRHHVDPKKLRAWKKKLKKSEVDTASLYTLMKAKYQDHPQIIELLKSIGPDGLEAYINMFDPLDKSAAPKLTPAAQTSPLANQVGKTHTVEVHPHLDQLYRAKGLIKENNRSHLNIGDYKKHGFPHKILPRDAHGKVTPEMIDKHIAGLPKHKVNVKVEPYGLGMQQHRPGDQYGLTVNMHPESKLKMDPNQQKLWEKIKGRQHGLNDNHDPGSADQIGWSRVDPHSKDNHWHIDEMQSDFQNHDKIKSKSQPNQDEILSDIAEQAGFSDDLKEREAESTHAKEWLNNEDNKKHPAYGAIEQLYEGAEDPSIAGRILKDNKLFGPLTAKSQPDTITDKDIKDLHQHLSHGHEDPQHLIHSATNALGRKLGVKSMSMDMPQDQAKQSHLSANGGGGDFDTDRFANDMAGHVETTFTPEHFKDTVENSPNRYLRDTMKKLGFDTVKDALYQTMEGSEPQDQIHDHLEDNPKYMKLSTPEKDALTEYVADMADNGPNFNDYMGGGVADPNEDIKVPVHQQDTYHKRPRKLGMKEVDKTKLLGEHPKDKADKVQYMNLHKKLRIILDLIKNSK